MKEFYTIEFITQECATLRKGMEHAESLKSGLEKEVKALKDASATSTEEVKRLSGTVSSKERYLYDVHKYPPQTRTPSPTDIHV